MGGHAAYSCLASNAGFCTLHSSLFPESRRAETKRGMKCESRRCKHENAVGLDTKSSRKRSQKQQLKREALASYGARFGKALQAELSEEMQAMKERMRSWSSEQLEAEGFALFNLSVAFESNVYRKSVLKFYLSYGNGFLPSQNQFSQGDIVLISQTNPAREDDNVVEGVVMERARRYLKVAVSKSQARLISTHTKWCLDLSTNHIAYERCISAIEAFSSPAFPHQTLLLEQSKVSKKKLNGNDFVVSGEAALTIRRILMVAEEERQQSDLLPSLVTMPDAITMHKSPGTNGSAFLEAIKIACSPPCYVTGKLLGAFKGGIRAYLREMEGQLNVSQQAAIEAAACQKVTLWQGPPGTGKTWTTVHLIRALSRSWHGKIIACADSNVAVDNLVEGLLDLGLQVARVGQPAKVKEGLRECTVEALVAAHPLMKKAAHMKMVALAQRKKVRQMNSRKMRSSGAKEAHTIWDDAIQLEAQAIKDVLERVDVVATTCVGAADAMLEGQSFRVCVIDEATQATEPATLIPIIRSGADSIVLVGDPVQLPPTVLSLEALERGLGVSLFERLHGCGLKPHLLNIQYRMHPAIAAVPSALFYSSLVKSHPMASERPAPNGFPWLQRESPLAFLDYPNGKEECQSEKNSWFNHVEALEVMKVVELLVAGNDVPGGCQGIGVIAPYNAQVRLLQDMFFPGQNEQQERFAGLEVKTVDGFQGLEKEAIVLCTVRSNEEGRLGFVADPRRMNVALTRAKRALIVIGNSKTLEFDETWAAWLKEMRMKGLFMENIS